jgi:hypothetical protein
MNLPSDLQRLLPFVAVAVLGVVGIVLVVRGVGGGGEGATDAQQVLRQGLETRPKSGVAEIRAGVVTRAGTGKRAQTDRAAFSARGSFVEPTSASPFALGENDVTEREVTNGREVVVRQISTGERGFLQVRGRWYELTEAQARRVFNDEETGRRASSAKEAGFDLERWTRAPQLEGGARVDGVETDRLVGALNVDAMLADMGVAEDASPQVAGVLKTAQKQGEVEVFVGREDRILRRASVRGEVLAQGPGGTVRMTIRLDVEVGEVGRPQPVTAPQGALPPDRIRDVRRSALGANADAIFAGGSRTPGRNGAGGGRPGTRRSSQAYVTCVQQAGDPAALEKCQALLP